MVLLVIALIAISTSRRLVKLKFNKLPFSIYNQDFEFYLIVINKPYLIWDQFYHLILKPVLVKDQLCSIDTRLSLRKNP